MWVSISQRIHRLCVAYLLEGFIPGLSSKVNFPQTFKTNLDDVNKEMASTV